MIRAGLFLHSPVHKNICLYMPNFDQWTGVRQCIYHCVGRSIVVSIPACQRRSIERGRPGFNSRRPSHTTSAAQNYFCCFVLSPNLVIIQRIPQPTHRRLLDFPTATFQTFLCLHTLPLQLLTRAQSTSRKQILCNTRKSRAHFAVPIYRTGCKRIIY